MSRLAPEALYFPVFSFLSKPSLLIKVINVWFMLLQLVLPLDQLLQKNLHLDHRGVFFFCDPRAVHDIDRRCHSNKDNQAKLKLLDPGVACHYFVWTAKCVLDGGEKW